MSGKQNSSLTFEAALGACLSFAGQVLSAASPPTQVCTKEALRPIVVEAHRFGQQVSKSCGSSTSSADKVSTSVDPRKLLKKLQNFQSEPEWDRAGVQIDRLMFEDLTWDSQGEVVQTLEMELLELESRATEANLSVCVLLMLRLPASGAKATMAPESAILWLPLESHVENNNGKRQYLLYACPGRIKVVKSVVELLKKLREEVKLMSDSDAIYNVWTLSRAATSQVKKKLSASALNPHLEVDKVQAATSRSLVTPEKAHVVVDVMKEKPDEETLVEERRASPEGDEAPRSQRAAISIRPVQKEARVLPNSIFSFTREPIVRAQVECGTTSEHLNSVENVKKDTVKEEDATSTAAAPVPSQQRVVSPSKQVCDEDSPSERLSAPSRRPVVPSSYSNGIPASARLDLKQERQAERSEMLWQSLDSDLMKPMLPLDRTYHTANASKAGLENVATDSDQSVSPSASTSYHDGTPRLDGSTGREPISSHQNSYAAPDKNTSSTFIFSQRSPVYDSHNSSQLPANVSLVASRSSEVRGAEALASNHHRQSRDQQVKKSVSGLEDSGNVDQDGVGTFTMEDKADIDCNRGSHSDSRKPAPIRKNYKAKLGNRVWWELQCAAEKLLQEQGAVEPVKRMNHSEKHTVRKKDQPSSEHRAARVTTSRSPPKNVQPQSEPREILTDNNRSQMNLSSSSRAIAQAHLVPAEIILTEGDAASVPKPVPTSPQVHTEQVESAQLASVSRSVTREFLQARVHDQEPQTVNLVADRNIPSQRTTMGESSSHSSQPTPDDDRDQSHNPLFTKRSGFEQDQASSAINNKVDKRQHSARKASVTARLEEQSHEEVNVSKSHIPPTSLRTNSSKKPAKSSHTFDFYSEVQAETRELARAPEPRRSHDANPTWNANFHDVNRSCDTEDGDDDLVQNQWASTRTSYVVERERDREPEILCRFEPPAATISQSQTDAKTPFNVHGRVPIRSNRGVPTKSQSPQFDDVDSSSDEENDTMGRFESSSRKPSQSAHKVSVPRPISRHDVDEDDDFGIKAVEAKPREGDRRPPHVATFITFEQDTKASSSKKGPYPTATNQKHHQTPSREEKLAELRAKKLSQLHKAREEQQQQQQQKKNKTSLLLQKTRSNLAAQASGIFDEHFAPTSTPGKTTNSLGSTTTHLRAAKKPSNKKLIQNALEYTLLAGFSMEKERSAALQALALSTCDNFIVLLKSTKDLKFRALYEHHTDRQEVVKLFASAPNAPLMLTEDTIGQFFKYNSGKKEFVAIDSRAFTMKTDACALKDELVFKKKTGLGKLL